MYLLVSLEFLLLFQEKPQLMMPASPCNFCPINQAPAYSWHTLFPGEDERQHLPQRYVRARNVELAAVDEQRDGLRHIAQVGAGQQLRQHAQCPLHRPNEAAQRLAL